VLREEAEGGRRDVVRAVLEHAGGRDARRRARGARSAGVRRRDRPRRRGRRSRRLARRAALAQNSAPRGSAETKVLPPRRDVV
jgi:hypothetical protein